MTARILCLSMEGHSPASSESMSTGKLQASTPSLKQVHLQGAWETLWILGKFKCNCFLCSRFAKAINLLVPGASSCIPCRLVSCYSKASSASIIISTYL